MFGALTIASFAVVIGSGTILALFGPQWWHINGVGHFFNSLHLWSVEAYFFFMVLHLWGMFFLGAWRDRRGKTWAIGATLRQHDGAVEAVDALERSLIPTPV